MSLFSSLVGTEKDLRRRVTEARTLLGQSGRTATYSGGFTAIHERKGWSWSGGAWLVAKAVSADLDLDAAYDSLDLRLRLVGTRKDDSTTEAEMAAISRLLSDLGFVSGGQIKDLPVPAKVPTRLSFNLELGAKALSEVLAGLDSATRADLNASEEWDLDFLNAASRWFDSRLVDTSLKSNGGVLAGPVLSRVVASPEYRDVWRLGTDFNLSVDGVPIDSGRYPEIKDVGRARGVGVRRLKTAHGVFLEARKSRLPSDLFRLSTRVARAAGAVTPHFWANPTFLTWLVLARLTRRRPQLLSDIQGVATFRWQDAAEEWREPALFKLDLGVPKHSFGGNSIFPVDK